MWLVPCQRPAALALPAVEVQYSVETCRGAQQWGAEGQLLEERLSAICWERVLWEPALR